MCVYMSVCACGVGVGGGVCKCAYIIVLLLGKIFTIVINPIIKERKFT